MTPYVCCAHTSPLARACANGNFTKVKKLVELGVDINAGPIPPLIYAVRINNIKIVKYLLDNGANINSVENNNGNTALIWACFDGLLDTAKFLVENGADVNSTSFRGKRALQAAAMNGHFSVVKFLIKNGADIHHTCKCCGGALDSAIGAMKFEIAEFLLQLGATPYAVYMPEGGMTWDSKKVQLNDLEPDFPLVVQTLRSFKSIRKGFPDFVIPI